MIFAATTEYFQWGRIQDNADWLLPAAVLTVLVYVAYRIYRYDAAELAPGWRWTLTALRVAAFAALFLIFLKPEWRAEREVQQNSQVVLMVDTSLSMGLPNTAPTDGRALAAAESGASDFIISRQKTVIETLTKTPLVADLRKKHDVILAGFDSATHRVVTLKKVEAVQDAGHSAADTETASKSGMAPDEDENVTGAENALPDLTVALEARGMETRLADAVRGWIQGNRAAPLAGVVVFSDGVLNAGSDLDAAVQTAKDARIPIYTVGFGSTQPMENVRIYDLEAPVRVQPGDPFSITALVQGYGLSAAGGVSEKGLHSVKVDLFARPAGTAQPDAGAPNYGTLLETKEVLLSDDGKVMPVRFEITPSELGKFTYTLRAQPRPKEQMLDDNQRDADVEVVDRKTKVLMLAGGPTREYQFLMPTLFRDKSMEVDVYLQSALPGISQEAAKILDGFPITREEMFQYDAVIAVDPNWKDLTGAQVALLDDWISRQGGGIILIAGAVYMGETVGGWIEDPAMTKIRAIYPVEFIKRFSTTRRDTFTARDPWPVDFTREGMEANFLKLEDSATDSQRAWAEFPGVYGYFPTKGPKSGATVLAWFSDPSKREGDNLPVLISSQFFGAGRVLYLGTGEMWRLRNKNPEYFTRIYTQMIRFVAQGRMMQQSNRGRLMVARDRYTLGDSVEIRAQLMDGQMNPLSAPTAVLEAFMPDGRVQMVTLHGGNPEQPGLYTGNLTVMAEGIVRLEIPLEGVEERLSRRVEVTLPDLERENPQQNRLLLERLAAATGGTAFTSTEDAVKQLPELIRDRTRTITLAAAVDPARQRELLKWLMIAAVTALCAEWLLRRLLKLA